MSYRPPRTEATRRGGARRPGGGASRRGGRGPTAIPHGRRYPPRSPPSSTPNASVIPKSWPWRRFRLRILLALGGVLISAALLSWYVLRQPQDIDDLCLVFAEKTDWVEKTGQAAKRWGIPVAVLMAVIRQESSFRYNAVPEVRLFGLIPWGHPTSAYGYAQALDATWDDYVRITGNKYATRDDFAHAVDFVGWYLSGNVRRLNIPPSDVFRQYLAYHEGPRGFQEGSFRSKDWLLGVARKVERYAFAYDRQLARCHPELAGGL